MLATHPRWVTRSPGVVVTGNADGANRMMMRDADESRNWQERENAELKNGSVYILTTESQR